jgi:hypothetical protein
MKKRTVNGSLDERAENICIIELTARGVVKAKSRSERREAGGGKRQPQMKYEKASPKLGRL